MDLSKKHASKEFLVKVKVKNFINKMGRCWSKERYGSRKAIECKRRDHKIKLVEEIKKNKALV